ncbi:NPCBM/NEW2 domain-containing protein [Paenibacillus spongiae]|uniref:NPCBM/NEW2 domain-containing protein n=1 Tax=Paenibacillus spongiae TaxID=2909671 RepID=A0ABY5SFR6_9BACL|nr:NPCBM/NEW2 domain-containing protein [Paenibacillus spongiae]UVI31108.1 NPCBM/NEW2 domain-containing protein [Paenibacillus spongiae]
MRNRRRLWIALLSCTWLLSGCSGGDDGGYGKLMAEADQAMESLDVDTAIAQYRKIAEMDPNQLQYGEGRIAIVNELLEDAEDLKGKLDELKSRSETVKQNVGSLDMEKAEAEEIAQVNGELNDILSSLEEFSSTGLYGELEKLRSQLAEDVKTRKIDPLLKEIEADIGKLEFDKAESNAAVLYALGNGFSELVGSAADEYSAKIETEKAKYIELPATYNQRNIVLLQNAAGKITFLGEGIKDDELALFYKYEGDLRFAAKELPPKIQAVFNDGNAETSDEITLRHLPDHAIGYQVISDDPNKALIRLDYRFGLQQDEAYKKVDIGPAGETQTLKEITALPDKELQTSLKITSGKMNVEISGVSVQQNIVAIQGKLTASEDMNLETDASLYVPANDLSKQDYMDEDLFAGVAKEFKAVFDLGGRRISNDTTYLKFGIAGIQVNIDLASGEEHKPGKELLIHQLILPSEDAVVFERFNPWDKQFLADASGQVFADGISFEGQNSWAEAPSFTVSLNQRYKRLTAKVGVDKTTVGSDFGSSAVKIMGDGQVLKTFAFGSSAPAAVDLDVSIEGIHTLQFIMTQTPGPSHDVQRIIIGDGTLTQ